MSDTLVVVSKVKSKLKELELRTSSEFVDKLSEMVAIQIERAAERARTEKRKTVQAEDLA